MSQTARVLRTKGQAQLETWDEIDDGRWWRRVLPDRFEDYRRATERAEGRMPPVITPAALSPQEADNWQRERKNIATSRSGQSGRLRAVNCLDASLFIRQHKRFDQLAKPSEFMASILRKEIDGQRRLRIYYSSSDRPYPIKGLYGLTEAAADVRAGWQFLFILHNHTIQQRRPLVLGVPTLSTSDADLMRAMNEQNQLQAAWVTNGLYTFEVAATDFIDYLGRDSQTN